jgi:uncharacterized protein involved in outer membrane biogenesis
MRLWAKLLIGALVLVLVLVAGSVLFISQVDPNAYRGAIADIVADATGRELRVGGDLRITLLPLPSMEANDVTFANASWASQPYMVQAKRVRASVALLPLLKGRIVVHRFVAIEPKVFLETDADGKGNWQFGDEAPASAETGDDSGSPSAELDLIVSEVRIENGSLDYLDGMTKRKTVVNVDQLTIGSERSSGRLALSLRATYQDLPVTLDGRLGAIGAVLRNQPIDVDLAGTLGDAGFTVKGVVGEPLEARDLRLDVALKSKSTKKITDVAGVEIEELGPVELTFRLLEEGGLFSLDPVTASARVRDTDAHVRGSVKNFALDLASKSASATVESTPMRVDLEGGFGDASFRVTGDVGKPLEGKDVRLDVTLQTKSTRSLTELAGIEFEEIGPVDLALTLLERDGSYDFENIKVTARPRGTDASMGGSIKNLVIAPDATRARGKPAKVDIKGTLGEARFTVSGEIGKPMEGKDFHLTIVVKAKSTISLTDLAGVEVEEVGPLDLKVAVIDKDGRFDLGRIDLTARPRDAHVTIKGSVLDLAGDPRPNLDLSLSAKTLRQLHGALPAAGPVSASANVRPRGKIIEIRDLVAKVGKSDLSGSATLDMGGEQPSASATLHASMIDLVELLSPADKGDTGASVETPSGGRIFPDDPLPLAWLRKANGKIELSIDRLITRKLMLSAVRIAAGLDNGNLTTRLAAGVAGGTVGATIGIDARAQPAKFAVDVDATKVSIGALTKEIRGYETSKGLASDLKMKLRGQGDSVRALMAGLDGDIRLEIGEGRLNNDVLDRVGADLLNQVLSVAVPTDEEDEATILNCGVVRFRIEDGEAIADQTIVLETEKVLVKGGGLIDLETESLDLGARLAARKGIRLGAGTLSSLMKVQGTLADPRLGTDLTGVVTTGARVGIAIATVGLSLVAENVYGRITEDDHPCQTALARQIEITPSDYRAQRVSEEN